MALHIFRDLCRYCFFGRELEVQEIIKRRSIFYEMMCFFFKLVSFNSLDGVNPDDSLEG